MSDKYESIDRVIEEVLNLLLIEKFKFYLT
jgi:hypothetical protein